MEYRLWHLATYPTILFLLGFIPVRIFGKDWDTVFLLLSFCFIGNCVGIYILIDSAIDLYRARTFENQLFPPRQPVTVNAPDLNQTFALSSPSVQIDVEKALAVVLMQFPDLTEKKWIKAGVWQSIGGSSPQQFRDILDKWYRAGVIAKKNPNAKNSPYRIARKADLARIAGGRLPFPSLESGQKLHFQE